MRKPFPRRKRQYRTTKGRAGIGRGRSCPCSSLPLAAIVIMLLVLSHRRQQLPPKTTTGIDRQQRQTSLLRQQPRPVESSSKTTTTTTTTSPTQPTSFTNTATTVATTTTIPAPVNLTDTPPSKADTTVESSNDGDDDSSTMSNRTEDFVNDSTDALVSTAVDSNSANSSQNSTVNSTTKPSHWIPLTEDDASSFYVTSYNTPACIAAMEEELPVVALHVVREQLETNHVTNATEAAWRRVVEACHGPVPNSTQVDLTAAAWYRSMLECDEKYVTPTNLPCREFFDRPRQSERWEEELTTRFVESATCVLHTQMQLQAPPTTTTATATSSGSTNNNYNSASSNATVPSLAEQFPGWKPKRVVVVALALFAQGAVAACDFARTGLPRGWEIVLVTGTWKGLNRKFSQAREAIEYLVQSSPPNNKNNTPPVPIEDYLIIFADAVDVYIQGTPEQVVADYLAQPHRFLFSGEHALFPNAWWPFGLTVGDYLRDVRFARPSPERGAPQGKTHYVNTGGWIGDGRAAMDFLAAMADLTGHADERNLEWCYEKGSDQFLGNAFHLRYSDKLGVDRDGSFVLSSPNDKVSLMNTTGTSKFCFQPQVTEGKETAIPGMIRCPAMLHFNGGNKQDEQFHSILAELVKRDPQGPPVTGSATIVHLDSQTVRYNQTINGCDI